MRLLLTIIVLSEILRVVGPADAKKVSRSANTKVYGYQDRSRGSSAECDRANDVHPARNYSGYPYWAARALSPKPSGN
jgi:hypothetical protein